MTRIETRSETGQELPPPTVEEREAAASLGGGRKAQEVVVGGRSGQRRTPLEAPLETQVDSDLEALAKGKKQRARKYRGH